jgi:hypothetical protein
MSSRPLRCGLEQYNEEAEKHCVLRRARRMEYVCSDRTHADCELIRYVTTWLISPEGDVRASFRDHMRR